MIGIVDFQVDFPKSRLTVEQMHETSGRPVADIRAWTHCSEIPVYSQDEPAWELVAEVARAVLGRSKVRPDQIGQVIYAGSGDWDFPGWSPAAKVASELGIAGAHCFEVINFCASASASLQIAADAIASGRVEYALVLFGEQSSRSIDYTDPDSVSLFNTGDCAVAVLLGSSAVRFEFVRTRSVTDPTWSDFYVGEYEEGRVVTRRRGRQLSLPKAYLDNFTTLTQEMLAALGLTVGDVRYLMINHTDRRMHERLLDILGIPAQRSIFNYERFGHMGCGDAFIALTDVLARQQLQSGDHILLATSGTGFSWGITALRFQ